MSRRSDPTRHLSLRLTDEERQKLQQNAGHQPVSAYVRSRLFGSSARARAIRVPSRSDIEIARVLSALGRSEMAANLKELADAIRHGVLPVTTETEVAIVNACASLQEMRRQLMQALGLREGSTDDS